MSAVPHGLLLVDKPSGITSHDVVSRVRRLLGTKKVGHAGTLDPAAEGLVVVAVGAATRLLPFLNDTSKEYVAQIVLGCASDSADLEGGVVASEEFLGICRVGDVGAALDRFIGNIDQVPPAHSAIKLAGQPLYRRARRGETVEVPVRSVTIHQIELLDFDFPDVVIRVSCSSGTYIRSIARDLGEMLGTGGYLHHLLRMRVGRFDLLEAWSLSDLEQSLSIESWPAFGLHPDIAVAEWPALIIDQSEERTWYDGRPIANSPAVQSSAASRARAFDPGGEWIGLAQMGDDDSSWHPKLVVAPTGHRQRGDRSDV